ncbi:MAG: hypothetical protein AAFR79_06860, partial [Pseudomonadota bacterium]
MQVLDRLEGLEFWKDPAERIHGRSAVGAAYNHHETGAIHAFGPPPQKSHWAHCVANHVDDARFTGRSRRVHE